MNIDQSILLKIKTLIRKEEPKATIILYGSGARGENHKDSDIDLLILIDKEFLTRADEKRVTYALYDLEFDSGQIISPIVFTKKDWEFRHKVTPLYESIQREGILL